jgi:hypothetical protein
MQPDKLRRFYDGRELPENLASVELFTIEK